jgi:thiamine-monophosphate kinase
VHFRPDWSSSSDIGFKAVSVNVSDLAAMGATPRWLLVVMQAPADTALDELDGIYTGMAEACGRYGVEVIGGDTVRARDLVLAVTALGEVVGDPLTRSGAKPGDILAVTGSLGRAAAGVNLLLSGDPKQVEVDDALVCLEAHRRPVARVDEGRRLREAGVHAAIDISDGLASDAIRIAEASGVGVELDADRLPIAPEVTSVAAERGWDARRIVLGGGEDLELLVAAPPGIDLDALGLVACGRVVDEGVWLVEAGGERTPLWEQGYDHFRGEG